MKKNTKMVLVVLVIVIICSFLLVIRKLPISFIGIGGCDVKNNNAERVFITNKNYLNSLKILNDQSTNSQGSVYGDCIDSGYRADNYVIFAVDGSITSLDATVTQNLIGQGFTTSRDLFAVGVQDSRKGGISYSTDPSFIKNVQKNMKKDNKEINIVYELKNPYQCSEQGSCNLSNGDIKKVNLTEAQAKYLSIELY